MDSGGSNESTSSRLNDLGRDLFQRLRGQYRPFPHSPPSLNSTSSGSLSSSSSSIKHQAPIHERETPADPQSLSVLYNGRIPAEIRNAIFDFALTEYTKVDLTPSPRSNTYQVNTNYTRPGYSGKKTIDIALLQACRRTYLETYHLLPVKKEHVFWHTRGPPTHAGSTLEHNGEQEIRYFERFAPWQLALVEEIHLFTQLFWLEGVLQRMCKRNFMQGIRRIKITVRRGDWWWNESNRPLGINPQRGGAEVFTMLRDWASEAQGEEIPWSEGSWGCSFSHMRSLKQLELEFETSDDKEDELKAIVQKARTWRFPAWSAVDGTELVFSADGFVPAWSSWMGPMCLWSGTCPYCGSGRACRVSDPPNRKCLTRKQAMDGGQGPLCHVASLKWRIARKDV